MKALGALALGALVLAAPGPIDPRSSRQPDGETIHIEAEPLSVPADYKLNGLRLISALRLSSADMRFGGWSAIRVEPDGDFLALSDRAFLLKGKISADKDGAPTGFADARIAVLRDSNGQPPSTVRGDSEGLTRMEDGRFMMSFELTPRLMIYDFARDGLAAIPSDGPNLLRLDALVKNEQLEAAATLADGSLLVGSERGANGDDAALLWRVPRQSPKATLDNVAPLTTIKLPPGFSLTELAGAPDGSFFALYRAYSLLGGAAAQIWRFRFTEADGKTSTKGELIATLEPPFPTDNYEGMSLVTDAPRAQRLYVISDDNYRDAQSTILLVFELGDSASK